MLTFIALIAMTLPSHALVDLKTGSYVETWTDVLARGAGFDLAVRRSYNSGSTYRGMFGYGWCSDYEANLDVTPEGAIKVSDCGRQGQRTIFSSGKQKSTGAMADEIIKGLKLKPAESKAVRQRLMRDSELRIDYAHRAGVKFAQPKPGQVFSAPGPESDIIQFDGQYFTRNIGARLVQKFDAKGRLVSMDDNTGNGLRFEYAGSQLRIVADKKGRKLNFRYVAGGNEVEEVQGPNGKGAKYAYKGNLLVEALNASGQKYKYTYDGAKLLTQTVYPDKSKISVSYDSKFGWVTKLNENDKCTQNYAFSVEKTGLNVESKRTCKGAPVVKSSMNYAYGTGAGDSVSKLKRTAAGVVSEVVYDPVTNQPKFMTNGKDQSAYTYFADGRLKTKVTRFSVETYEYSGKHKKLARISSMNKDPKGKARGTNWTQFSYDDSGRLLGAKTSDGRNITIARDGLGRIASIADQRAKKVVSFNYDPMSGLLKTVSEPKLGQMQFQYDGTGRLQAGKSTKGLKGADQLSALLNGVLGVIRPAASDILI